MHFRRAGVEDMQHHPLSLLNPKRLPETHHPSINGGHVIDGVHRAVVRPHQMSPPVMQPKKELLVVACWVDPWLHKQEAMLAPILSTGEIVHRHGMRVIPAKAARLRREVNACRGPGTDKGCSFLGCTIQFACQEQAMPMHDLGILASICDLDRHWTAFLEAEQRSRNLSVVGSRLQEAAR